MSPKLWHFEKCFYWGYNGNWTLGRRKELEIAGWGSRRGFGVRGKVRGWLKGCMQLQKGGKPESKHRTPKPRRELGEGKTPAPQTLEEGTGGILSQGSPPSLPKLPQKSDGTAGFKLRGGGAGPPSTHRDSGCRSLLRGTPVRPRPAARPRPAPGRLRPPRASFAPPARLPRLV